MAGRIVLFGATGYTGRLVADALVERGAAPLLAARDARKLAQLAEELGGLDVRVADVSRPETVRAVVEPGDVLVTTVGPYLRYGDAAVQAAIDARASAYIDSTGEAPFIRRVFEEFGPQAARAGTALLTASAYDYVPGNLAAALALREAGQAAKRVEIAYFTTGSVGRDSMSSGTAASAAGMAIEPVHGYRGGRIVSERGAKRVVSFDVKGRSRQAVSVGTTEHFSLPRLYPQLQDVDVYVGWFGPVSRVLQGFSLATSVVTRMPGTLPAMRSAVRRFTQGSGSGPDAPSRAKSGSHIVAYARDEGGRVLAEAHLEGVNGYTFTGRIMAWAAERAIDPGIAGKGAVGPVEAFGLEDLEAGCEEAGLEARVAARTAD